MSIQKYSTKYLLHVNFIECLLFLLLSYDSVKLSYVEGDHAVSSHKISILFGTSLSKFNP